MWKLCAIEPGATSATEPTHRLLSMAVGDEAELATLQAMTQGDLPASAMGVVRGVDGVIDGAAAMATCDG